MPVIQHQTIGRDAYPGPVVGLSQNLLKCGVVSRLVKQRESSNSSVEDMIGEASSSEARAAWRIFYRNRRDVVKKRLPPPFLCPDDDRKGVYAVPVNDSRHCGVL